MAKTYEKGPAPIFRVIVSTPEPHRVAAWKVAYADFVTAMMAFFLLLWLLNAVEKTILIGIANHFTPTRTSSPSPSGSGGIGGGTSLSTVGILKINTVIDVTSLAIQGDNNIQSPIIGRSDKDERSSGSEGKSKNYDDDRLFDTASRRLSHVLNNSPLELQALKQTIQWERTPEGLLIRIVDQPESQSFLPGSARLSASAIQSIGLVAEVLKGLPNGVSVSGHTDVSGSPRTNLALSARRAEVVRATLESLGVDANRFVSTIGKGSTQPLNEDNPLSNENRRFEILLSQEKFVTYKVDSIPPSLLFSDE